MRRSTRRLIALLMSMPLLLLVSAVLYAAGMARLEGKPRDFWQSLAWAGETLTTTGYGADARWTHPAMVLLVVAVQFAGVLLVFLVVPVYLIPFLEERFEARLPRTVRARADHVIVFRHGPTVAALPDELRRAGVGVTIVEEDPAETRRLLEAGESVLHRRLDEGALEAAGITRARALVVNGRDADNAAATLTARQLGFGGPILALVEEPLHRHPMVLAGATDVFTPRHVLAAVLVDRAIHQIRSPLAGIEPLGGQVEVDEMRVRSSSELAGRTLREAAVGSRTGAVVVGQWLRGRLDTGTGPESRIEPGGILVAAGGRDSLDRLRALAGLGATRRRASRILVAGHGVVGRKAVEILRDSGHEVTVLDQVAAPGVDVAGSAFDRAALERGHAADARAVLLALDSDAATLFATVIVRDLSPDVPIFARVNQPAFVERIHQAGADVALSISQVAGNLLAHRLLGERAVTIAPRLRLSRLSSAALSGRRPAEARLRQTTGCSVVLVERDGRLLYDLGGDFRFADGDALYVAGSEESTARFCEQFGARSA